MAEVEWAWRVRLDLNISRVASVQTRRLIPEHPGPAGVEWAVELLTVDGL